MKIEEFTNTINELQKFYDKKMNQEELKIWFDNFKAMDLKRFKYLIGQIYRTNKFMPKLADLIELNKNIGYDRKVFEEQIKNLKHCEKCKDTGYIIYQKKIYDSLYDYVAVCSCGRQKQYKSDKYYVPLATELGI